MQYGRELTRMRAAMTETERRRVDAIAEAEENRLAIAAELARQQALGDMELHLAVHGRAVSCTWSAKGHGSAGRAFAGSGRVRGTPPDAVLLAPRSASDWWRGW